MFGSLCIRNQSPSDTQNPVDLGLLAESMLFYPNVLVLAKQHMLEQLVRRLGPEILIEYLDAGYLQLKYEFQQTGVQTRNSGGPQERHTGILFHSPNHALQHIAPEIFTRVTGKSGKGRRLANRFTKLITTVERVPTLLSDFESDLLDPKFVTAAIQDLLNSYVPEYNLPRPFLFHVSKEGSEFVVETNIDFDNANRYYHQRIPPSHSSLSTAYFLSHLLTMRENLQFTSQFNSDISVDPVNSQLLTTKVNGLLDRYCKNQTQITSFQEFNFDDGKALRDAINSGTRSFKEFLSVLEKAERFRGWLNDKPVDGSLIKEYYREVTKSSWVDALPAKSFRWMLFTGAGLAADSLGAGGVGTAMGLGLSAIDSFFVDRLIKGWKPNHFIEGTLRKFLAH